VHHENSLHATSSGLSKIHNNNFYTSRSVRSRSEGSAKNTS